MILRLKRATLAFSGEIMVGVAPPLQSALRFLLAGGQIGVTGLAACGGQVTSFPVPFGFFGASRVGFSFCDQWDWRARMIRVGTGGAAVNGNRSDIVAVPCTGGWRSLIVQAGCTSFAVGAPFFVGRPSDWTDGLGCLRWAGHFVPCSVRVLWRFAIGIFVLRSVGLARADDSGGHS